MSTKKPAKDQQTQSFPPCLVCEEQLTIVEKGVVRCPNGHAFYWEKDKTQLVKLDVDPTAPDPEEKEKDRGGRPSKYTEDMPEKLIEYFNINPSKEIVVTETDKKGNTREWTKEVANELPTLAGFASLIGVHRDTLHEWAKEENAKKHPRFSDAYKRAKEHQERILVANGLRSLYSAPFAIFTAKNVLGWRDKAEIDHTSKGEKLNDLDTKSALEIFGRIADSVAAIGDPSRNRSGNGSDQEPRTD